MKNRIIYFDYLRVMAMISVVLLHVSGQNWGAFNGRSLTWNILNFYDAIVRWGVPVFIMISGSLFLSNEADIKKIYQKNIFRLLVVYFSWSIVYAFIIPIVKAVLLESYVISFKEILYNTVGGEYQYHMWFLPMIIGLYICVPLIGEIVKSPKATVYFLVLSFVFTFLIPQAVNISNDFVGGMFAEIVNKINTVIFKNMNVQLVFGYSFYFVLGYLMNNTELSKAHRFIIYGLGAVGFLSTILLNAVIAWKTDVPCATYYSNYSINVMLETVAIYTWFKYRRYENEVLNKLVFALSKYSLGVYLVHVFILFLLDSFEINSFTLSPFVSVPLISAIAIIVSFFVSWLLAKVPIINKWMI